MNATSSTDRDTAVEVDRLTKTFGSGDDSVVAVNDVSFAIQPGTVVGVLGPNGAGKTTTIKSILGLIRPDSGTIRIDGINIAKRPREAFGRVDAVLEGARNDYWRLTTRENLRYFATIGGENPDIISDRHENPLNKFNLAEKADVPVRDLSRGMKQKVALASVLASNISVAFLDEPTLGLDIESSLTLRKELSRIVGDRGLTVILSSHDMDVIEDVCDRVIIMNNGKITVDDRVEDLLGKVDTQGYRISVREANQKAPEWIKNRYQISNIEQFHKRARFELTITNETFYQLMSDLENGDLTLDTVETIQPDLEGIFLEATEGAIS